MISRFLLSNKATSFGHLPKRLIIVCTELTTIAWSLSEGVAEDLIFGLVESAAETPGGTGNFMCSVTVAVYTSALANTLAVHRARVSEVRDLFEHNNCNFPLVRVFF